MSDRRKSKVRFGNAIVFQFSQPLGKIEKSAAFYTKTDFRYIENEAFKDLLKSQLGKFLDDVDYCLRGLEMCSRTNEGKKKAKKRKEYIRAVLLEYKRHSGNNSRCQTMNDLCAFSAKLSYTDKVRARERGMQDENQVMLPHSPPSNARCLVTTVAVEGVERHLARAA
jgi:hypothetical protein